MGNHVHRWSRCDTTGRCPHPQLPSPHWRCGCGEATAYPPGEQHFMTPERVIAGGNMPGAVSEPEPEEMTDEELTAYVEVPGGPDPDPDWIVLRPAAGMAVPAEVDGLWLNRSLRPHEARLVDLGATMAQAAPTGRFEERTTIGQLQVAEVWELTPLE